MESSDNFSSLANSAHGSAATYHAMDGRS